MIRRLNHHARASLISGHGWALAAALIWSVNFPLIKIVRRELDATTLVGLRFEIAATMVLALWLAVRRPRLRGLGVRGWILVILMTALIGPLYQVLLASGAPGTSAGLIGLIIASQSLHTAWLAAILLHERFGWRQVAALAIGFLGLAAPILWSGNITYVAPLFPLLVFAASLVAPLNTVIPRMLHRHVESFDLATLVMVLAGVMCLPMFTPTALGQLGDLSVSGWSAMLWLGSIGHAGAFMMWYAALRKLSAVSTGFYLFVMMLGSTFWGWLILDETLSTTYALAALAVALGLWLNATAASGGRRPHQQTAMLATTEA
ncbi:MAG: DMT family transporter [Phycisphaeraceae bacterium]